MDIAGEGAKLPVSIKCPQYGSQGQAMPSEKTPIISGEPSFLIIAMVLQYERCEGKLFNKLICAIIFVILQMREEP